MAHLPPRLGVEPEAPAGGVERHDDSQPCYQQADAATMLRVVLEAAELQEAKA